MTSFDPGNTKKGKGTMESRSLGFYLFTVAFCLLPMAAGCRQKMSDQPYGRPLSASDFFDDGRMSRPLERGVIHRGQYLEFDPRVTGLTREEWNRAYSLNVPPKVDFGPAPTEDRTKAIGAPRYDPPGFTAAAGDQAHPGPQIYVNEFPFTIGDDDVRRGEERFTIYCAVCHGPLGNGQGKIWERRYLTPTSFHTRKVGPTEVDVENPRDIPLGYSRNYSLWGIKIPMTDVPIGYYYEIISKGYPGGGMPSYSAQIAPADRWRIIAYIRVLQLSQNVSGGELNQLPPGLREKLNAGGGKK
ncbi:MAG TPA: cytochrome c [Gemmata sp.]|nr:cytochrome c [Gemmata sp.]